jgi:hypothetical protein
MIITPITDLVLTLNKPGADADVGQHPRPPGIHVSGILRSIALKIGRLEADDADVLVSAYGGLPVKALLRVALGLAWEEWISERIPETAGWPGTLVLDGIHGSPDGMRMQIDDDKLPILGIKQLAIDEIKLTWTSAARPVADRWMWLAQTKAYCWMTEQAHTIPCRTARWYPYYVNGDYGKSGEWERGPVFAPVELEFTEDELRRNWQMIVAHKQDAVEEY